MIKFGGVRPTGKLRYLKSKRTRKVKSQKIPFKHSNKNSTLKKNIVHMLENQINKSRRFNRIKETYEKSEDSEEQVLKTSKKFVKLFDKIMNKDKYKKIRDSIEVKLDVLESIEGPIIERHSIKNEEFKETLEDEVSEYSLIETYRDVIKVALDTYKDADSEEREEASIFLSTVVKELYDTFFPKKSKNMNMNMNVNMNTNNSGLDELLKGLKI